MAAHRPYLSTIACGHWSAALYICWMYSVHSAALHGRAAGAGVPATIKSLSGFVRSMQYSF